MKKKINEKLKNDQNKLQLTTSKLFIYIHLIETVNADEHFIFPHPGKN